MATDYTNLAAVKAWLKVAGSDDDLVLSRLISAASDWIRAHLKREVLSTSYDESFDGLGALQLCLPQSPVTDVSAVWLNGVEHSSFKFDSFGPFLSGYRMPRGPGSVRVQYTAGYETLPADIEQCAIDLVAHNYRRRERIGQASKAMGGEVVSFTVSDVPPECKAALRHYLRAF